MVGLVDRDDGWRLPDWLWGAIKPLLPERPLHPLGCHNPRVPDRDAMDAILLVLRTGIGLPGSTLPVLASDDVAGRYLAAGHLAELGHARMAELGGPINIQACAHTL